MCACLCSSTHALAQYKVLQEWAFHKSQLLVGDKHSGSCLCSDGWMLAGDKQSGSCPCSDGWMLSGDKQSGSCLCSDGWLCACSAA